jgi:thiol-disulfide isomerase/thioredoxin
MTTRTDIDQAPPPAPRRRWRWRGLCAAVLLAMGIATAVAVVPNKNAGDRNSPVAPVDLSAARVRAGLRPCLMPGSPGAGPAALRGVRATCLGDGTTVDVGAVLAGRPVLINVWASWCEVCREELPVLDAYAAAPGAVPVLGVQVQSAPEDGLELLASLGVHLPSIVDIDQAVSRALRAPGYLPVSYVVSADGTIRQVLPPKPFRSVDEIAQALSRS